MKKRMNVTKKEAEQIYLWGEAIYDNGCYMYITQKGMMVFDIYGGSEDTKLSYENEYKDYEWRLTDIKDLKQGDICKVIYKCIPKLYIYIFDKITEHYMDVYENKTCALMWGIEDNRPYKDYPFENVYKLFKKSKVKEQSKH